MPTIKMKYLLFFFMLLILTIATIGNAFYKHNQYYPAILYLSKSSASMTVAYFVASNLLWVVGYWMMIIFFGELRPSENEELWERLKYVATETLMAFAIFRDDFSPQFAMLFAVLLYMKIIHWLGEERVDYLERSPILPKLFHARILSLSLILGIVDFLFVTSACQSIQTTGPSPHIAFGFEYSILFPSVCLILLKYVLHTIEIHRETPLEDKAIILLYGQIVFDFTKIVLYFSYLAVMFRLYLLPAFAFRQIFNTMRNFTTAVNDVVAFRKAVRYMNKFCPNASKEELDVADTVCIVCREDMISGAKKLPCNHIFHGSCLRSWFQRQQTCPTCRLKILNNISKEVFEQHPRNQGNVSHPPQSNYPQNTENKQNYVNPERNMLPQGSQYLNQTNQNFSNIHPSHSLLYNVPNNHMTNYSSTKQLSSSEFVLLCEDETLRNLSNQDLLAVERDTRAGIENRIKCLQSMSKMLDSTIVLMHQYCHASSFSNAHHDRSQLQLSRADAANQEISDEVPNLHIQETENKQNC